MKNQFKHFEQVGYPSLPASVVYGNTVHKQITENLFNNVVETHPDLTPVRGKQKARRPLRVCVYKDFKVKKITNTVVGGLWSTFPPGKLLPRKPWRGPLVGLFGGGTTAGVNPPVAATVP